MHRVIAAAIVLSITTYIFAADVTGTPAGIIYLDDGSVVYECEVMSFQQDSAGNMRILIPAHCVDKFSNAKRFDDVPAGYWAFDAITTIGTLGISSGCGGGNFCPDESVTRAEFAVMLKRALHLPTF